MGKSEWRQSPFENHLGIRDEISCWPRLGGDSVDGEKLSMRNI